MAGSAGAQIFVVMVPPFLARAMEVWLLRAVFQRTAKAGSGGEGEQATQSMSAALGKIRARLREFSA
jgi:hypothetical protein